MDGFVGVKGFSQAQADLTKAEIRKGNSEINTFNTFFGLGQKSVFKRCLICPEGQKSNNLKSDIEIVRHLNRDAVVYWKITLQYTLRRPLMDEVLSTRIWGVPPAGGLLL